MPQDAFTLRYLCEELNNIFKGGKVNRIIQPENDEVIFTIYTGNGTKRLSLDVNPGGPRIGVPKTEKKAPLTALNFCMLLRKHLLSATLNSIELIGFDRIVKIRFTASDEFFDGEEKTLYVELMGRYSNVILTQNGIVLGGNRGINFFDNGVRPLIVGRPYVLPPTNNKREPSDRELINYFKNIGEKSLIDYITDGVQGLAKSTANEIVFSFAIKRGKCSAEKGVNLADSAIICGVEEEFFSFLNDFIYSKTLQPTVYFDGNLVKDVSAVDYSLLPFDRKRFESLSEAEEFYFESKTYLKEFLDKSERLKSVCSSVIKKVKKRLNSINSKYKEAEKAEENKLFGELILSNIYKLKGGEEKLVAENYYDFNKEVEIVLDKRLSPQKNAENYYKKYNKQKRTLSALNPQKEQAETEIKYLESVLEEIALCESLEDVFPIKTELEAYGLIKEQSKKTVKEKQEKPYRNYIVDGFSVRVGRNNLENDKLTGSAKPEYMWLHSKDYHSSHVIIEGDGNYPERVIIIACEICAYFSKAREGGKSEIAYTLKKRVKKPSGGKPGFFIYTEHKSVSVEANRHDEYIVR